MIQLPSAVQKILTVLNRGGYEGYVVGGCVRDSLLGRIPSDWDVTTSALPEYEKMLPASAGNHHCPSPITAEKPAHPTQNLIFQSGRFFQTAALEMNSVPSAYPLPSREDSLKRVPGAYSFPVIAVDGIEYICMHLKSQSLFAQKTI